MGIKLSVQNDTDGEIPVRGCVRMIGTHTPVGMGDAWRFAIPAGKTFSNVDNGLLASSWYEVVLYVTPNGSSRVFRYVARVQAPASAARGRHCYVSDLVKNARSVKEVKGLAAKKDTEEGFLMDDTPKFIYGRAPTSPGSPTATAAVAEEHDEDGIVNTLRSAYDGALTYLTHFLERDDLEEFGREPPKSLLQRARSRAVSTLADFYLPKSRCKRFTRAAVTPLFFVVWWYVLWPLAGLLWWATWTVLIKGTLYVAWLALHPVLRLVLSILMFLGFAMALPRLLGMFLTNVLYYTALNRFPLIFGAIHLTPWIKDWSRLHLRVVAEDVKFGNPKGFTHRPWFLTCAKTDFHASIRFKDILALALWPKCEWSPFPVTYSDYRLGALSNGHKKASADIKFRLKLLNLPATKSGKEPSAYVKLRINGRLVETSDAIPEDEDPEFPEISVPHDDTRSAGGNAVRIEVWHRARGWAHIDYKIGEADIKLDELRFLSIYTENLYGENIGTYRLTNNGRPVYGRPKLVDDSDGKQRMQQQTLIKVQFQATSSASRLSHCSTVKFHYIEFDKLMINFTMSKGIFNINGFTKELAEGECRRQIARTLGKGIWPNTLRVRVIRARNLVHSARDAGQPIPKAPNTRVRISIRSQIRTCRLHVGNANPIIDELFSIPVKDPSAVFAVTVRDEGTAISKTIGQWRTTLKYLYTNPRYLEHSSMEVEQDGTIRGWFPLRDDRLDEAPCGEVELWFQWVYTQKNRKWRPDPLTALQQLQENSNETKLRLGNPGNVVRMLRRFPLLFEVQRVTIRNIRFFLKDLFLGREGEAERTEAEGGDSSGDFIFLPRIEVLDFADKQQSGRGTNLWKVCEKLVWGIIPEINSRTLGSATRQITSALAGGFTSLFARYRLNKAEHMYRTWQNLKAKMRRAFGLVKKHKQVTCYNEDYWKPITQSGVKSAPEMAGPLEIRNGNSWKLNWAEVRGNTLFYWEVNKQNDKVGIHQKLDISTTTELTMERKESNFSDEIVLQVDKHRTQLRVPITQGSLFTARNWYLCLSKLRCRQLPPTLLVHLIRATHTPPADKNGLSDPYAVVTLRDARGQVCSEQIQSTIKKKTLDPVWNQVIRIWPIPSNACWLRIELWDYDVVSQDDYVGHVQLHLDQIRGAGQYEGQRCLQLVDPEHLSDRQPVNPKLADQKDGAGPSRDDAGGGDGSDGNSSECHVHFTACVKKGLMMSRGSILNDEKKKEEMSSLVDETTQLQKDILRELAGDSVGDEKKRPKSDESPQPKPVSRAGPVKGETAMNGSSGKHTAPDGARSTPVTTRASRTPRTSPIVGVREKSNRVELMILSSKILRLLDCDRSRDLDRAEARVLFDLDGIDEDAKAILRAYFAPSEGKDSREVVSFRELNKFLAASLTFAQAQQIHRGLEERAAKVSKEKKQKSAAGRATAGQEAAATRHLARSSPTVSRRPIAESFSPNLPGSERKGAITADRYRFDPDDGDSTSTDE